MIESKETICVASSFLLFLGSIEPYKACCIQGFQVVLRQAEGYMDVAERTLLLTLGLENRQPLEPHW